MKLKMAKNSVFAVLLRSPWWVSLAVAAVIALAARALLPGPYAVAGMLGGFPFLVVGAIAAVRQFKAPSPEQVADTLEHAAAMSSRDFLQRLEQCYQSRGFSVARLQDAAADLTLTKDGRTTLVACKRWKAANHGVEPLRALVRARQAQDASHCSYVTLADVGDKTRRFATENAIELVHGAALAHLLGTPVGPQARA